MAQVSWMWGGKRYYGKRAAEIKRTAKAYKEGKRINLKAVQKSRANSGRRKKI